MATTIDKLVVVLENLHKKKVVTAYDQELLDRLELEPKQIGRILDELSLCVNGVVKEKIGKKNSYRLVEKIDLFEKLFFTSNELSWVYEMVDENISEVISALDKLSKNKDHIYHFKNTPYEDLKSLENKDTFNNLKAAVKYREYRNILFFDNTSFENVKCLKLVFMEGNWYIAFETKENELRFGRINFIKSVSYSDNISSFTKKSVEDKMLFLEKRLQNPFTVYEIKPQKAIIKATPTVAKYFKEGMKKFLDTQKFIKETDDGSVFFSVEFTQEMEILPFVQKWMPDLVVVEPKELADSYKKKIKSILKVYEDLS